MRVPHNERGCEAAGTLPDRSMIAPSRPPAQAPPARTTFGTDRPRRFGSTVPPEALAPVHLVLGESSQLGVTLHDHLALGMAQHCIDVVEAVGGKALHLVDHTLG